MAAESRRRRLHFRTVFISDVHLGSPAANCDPLIDFLRSIRCDTLYLVGDIIDVWSLKQQFFWPPAHNTIVRRIMKMARRGTRVVYIPGNHDEMFRDYVGLNFDGIEVARKALHETADGRRLLVMHGDEFDQVVQFNPWLARFGARAYERLIRINALVNRARRRFGYPHWSLAGYLKHRVKNAVQYIGAFEDAVVTAARREGVDGLVCGHIHHPEMREIDGVLYCNDGDWVESCSALVERADGRLEVLRWLEARPQLLPATPPVALPLDRAA